MSDSAPAYPPYGHIIRHLRMDLVSTSADELRATMPVSDDLRDAGRALRFGALATLIDVAAGTFSHDLVSPDWLATSDMKVHSLRPAFGDEVRSITTVVREGRRNVLSLNVVSDDEGELARSWVTYVRLPRREDSPTIERESHVGRRLHYIEKEHYERPSLDEYIGFEIRAGQLVFDLTHHPRIHNSFGSIQGGVAAMLIERMAMLAVERQLGGPGRVTDLHVHYIGQTRDGPFRIEGTILRIDADSVTVEVGVYDAGSEDRVLDLGTATGSLIPPDQLGDQSIG